MKPGISFLPDGNESLHSCGVSALQEQTRLATSPCKNKMTLCHPNGDVSQETYQVGSQDFHLQCSVHEDHVDSTGTLTLKQ